MPKIAHIFFLFSLSTHLLAQTGSLDDSFSTPSKMSDKQMGNAKNFVHQGVKDKALKESCQKQGLGKCDPNDVGGPGIESMIGKAYAAIFGGMLGAGSGGISLKAKSSVPKNTPPGAAAGQKTPGEAKTDYCMYAAMGYETIGGMMQQNLQQKAQSKATSVNDIQLQSLVNLKETHKARKTTATWQAGVYGGVSACYVAMGTFGGAAMTDWKYMAKLGGAVALTALYAKKAKKHGDAASKVQKVIDSLPKAGDCNPWTGTACFCKEASSKTLYPGEYQEVCVLNGGNFETPKVAVGCGTIVNKKMQFDKDCKCKQTNSCFRASLKGFVPSFALGKNFMNQANKGFDLLSKGEFDDAVLNSYSSDTAALASKIKGKVDPNSIPGTNLSDEEKKIADGLKQYMPGSLANIAAGSPDGSPPGGGGLMASSTDASLTSLPDDIKKKFPKEIVGNYNFGSGSGSGSNGSEETLSMPDFGGQSGSKDSTEIVSFAEEAFSKADVTSSPETPIFDIISNRYRRSGWEKLR
ncbi:MAG TPA: hypothetical protein VNJ01_02875 [Bacteriovoracaceae bacterium]|nr:hypothetical protein [Bacteriovoracaceae bacterium]